MLTYRLLACGFFALLSGCTMLAYEEPLSGDRARVRFASESPAVTILSSYEGEGCAGEEKEMLRVRDGLILFSKKKKLGIPLNDHRISAYKEVYISTDEPLHAMFFGSRAKGGMVTFCAVPFSVQFEADHDYEVLFDLRKEDQMCMATVSQIVNVGGKWEKQGIHGFNSTFREEQEGCREIFSDKTGG